jgi:hypothetical protein
MERATVGTPHLVSWPALIGGCGLQGPKYFFMIAESDTSACTFRLEVHAGGITFGDHEKRQRAPGTTGRSTRGSAVQAQYQLPKAAFDNKG